MNEPTGNMRGRCIVADGAVEPPRGIFFWDNEGQGWFASRGDKALLENAAPKKSQVRALTWEELIRGRGPLVVFWPQLGALAGVTVLYALKTGVS